MDVNRFKVGPCVGISVTEIGVEKTGLTAVAVGCSIDDSDGVVDIGEMVPVSDQVAGEIDNPLRETPFVGCNMGVTAFDANSPFRKVFGSKVIFRPDDTPVGKLADPGRLNKFICFDSFDGKRVEDCPCVGFSVKA